MATAHPVPNNHTGKYWRPWSFVAFFPRLPTTSSRLGRGYSMPFRTWLVALAAELEIAKNTATLMHHQGSPHAYRGASFTFLWWRRLAGQQQHIFGQREQPLMTMSPAVGNVTWKLDGNVAIVTPLLEVRQIRECANRAEATYDYRLVQWCDEKPHFAQEIGPNN
ncbi:uncharacterized protein B0T15DRAFT_123241 [Chaetomium strumarium]|uniref:Uncharacterized protein n=1 Tax=Chaetomium strumarium TaxID=1170767 RepID=A0AAJ0GZB3_9PEZI|nr:hypothetical protein B0T15DRAFT_123241 [Chaetomium strumarium]